MVPLYVARSEDLGPTDSVVGQGVRHHWRERLTLSRNARASGFVLRRTPAADGPGANGPNLWVSDLLR